MMYMGQTGCYTHTFNYEKKEDCMVCGGGLLTLTLEPASTFQALLDALSAHPSYKLARPSISGKHGIVFQQAPRQLRAQHEYKLEMTLEQLIRGEPCVIEEG